VLWWRCHWPNPNKNQPIKCKKKKKKQSRSIAATYMGEGIEFAVKDNFADPSRHLDVGYRRLLITCQPSHYGHARHLIQRHSTHARKRRGNKWLKQIIRNGYLKSYLYFSKQLAANRTFESETKLPLQKSSKFMPPSSTLYFLRVTCN
jgi:hypothetical protein